MAGVFQAKLENTKQEFPHHPRCFEDLRVMREMEGGEFFDRAVHVMSHSL